jgi:chemotaxis protein CheX
MTMDVSFINPFITSSRQVFGTMIQLPLELGKPHLRTYGTPNYTVSAQIGFAGAVTGCVVLGFSQQVALALASGLAQTPVEQIDADCIDALGEIVNMIAGAAKKDLPGGLSTISVPQVVLGSHKIKYPTGVPVMIIPCTTKAGTFTIEVAIKKMDPVAHAAPAAPAPAVTPAPAA